MGNPLVRLGHSLIPEFSADKWWDLRKKALSCKGIKHYYYAFRYEKMTGRFHAFIPLEAEIRGKPEFPHGISGIFVSCGAREHFPRAVALSKKSAALLLKYAFNDHLGAEIRTIII